MSKSKLPPRDVTMNLRVSAQEIKEWRLAAVESRRTLSQWIRDACNGAAQK